MLELDPTATAYPADAVPVTPPYSGRGRPPRPAYPGKASTLRELALAAGRRACRQVTWRKGTRKTNSNPTAAMRSHFLTIRVHPANRHIPRNADGTLPEQWLIAEWHLANRNRSGTGYPTWTSGRR